MALSPRVADLVPYDLLVSVATLGSMGRAAVAHGVSQAAVSARIRSLESALGLTLLERSPRGTRLTPDGALVVERARAALDAAHALDEGVAALRTDRAARLRVAASVTVAEYLLPRWLVALRAELPGTAVTLTSHNTAEVVDDVRSGDADLGFVEGPELPADLDGQVVARDRLVLVVAPDHPWAGRRAVDASRLASTPLVAREPGSGTRDFLERALGALAPPVLELGSTTAIKNAVAGGAGPAVISGLAVAAEVAAGTLRTVPVRGADLQRRLRAAWRRGRAPSGPALVLVRIASRR
ncbi:LysR family transcriptional regulator [Pseudonocardia alni]|uniref:DNA-binding transcriptional LysR family regulator n=1 Tax=Pseudonocardia alni TaxID=33907 RepID=A0AA44URJ5_PSEA5|nr:LysR family transcriptional regulator [Pseudonocardia alni]PKB31894.1 DNA-binding transcriptional LysR family regulator [Pseudonocardia alni]